MTPSLYLVYFYYVYNFNNIPNRLSYYMINKKTFLHQLYSGVIYGYNDELKCNVTKIIFKLPFLIPFHMLLMPSYILSVINVNTKHNQIISMNVCIHSARTR